MVNAEFSGTVQWLIVQPPMQLIVQEACLHFITIVVKYLNWTEVPEITSQQVGDISPNISAVGDKSPAGD